MQQSFATVVCNTRDVLHMQLNRKRFNEINVDLIGNGLAAAQMPSQRLITSATGNNKPNISNSISATFTATSATAVAQNNQL